MRTSKDLSLVTDWGFVTADMTVGARKESLKFREAYAASEGIKNRGSVEFSSMLVSFLVTPIGSLLKKGLKKISFIDLVVKEIYYPA